MVVQSIPLVSDLRSQNRNIATVFLATGLITEGDNAGGIYLWEPANTTPDDGFYSIQVTGVATGRWIRIGAASNIYTSDGTLLGNRTVTLGGHSLTFAGSTYSSVYNADGSVTLGSLAGTGTRYVVAGPSGLLGAAGTIPTPGTPTRFIETYTASAGQTTFNTANTLYTYFFDVYVNGVLLDPTSFTASANQVVLVDPCTNNDIVEIIGFYNITYVGTFPSQVGNAGKFLSTDGTNLLWSTNPLGTVTSVDMSVPTGFTISGNPITTSGTLAVSFAAGYSLPTTASQANWNTAYTFVSNFPSQSGNNGKYLTTNGSVLSWSTVDALPSQAGNAGKYLTTDGTNASWAVLNLAAYVPTSRTLTINGTTYDLSANRTWSVGTVTSVDMTVPTGLAISGNPITGAGTLALTYASGYSIPTNVKQSNWDDAYTWVANFPTQTGNNGKYLTTNGSVLSWATIDLSGYVPNSRTLTINGTTYDLSANRTWSVGTVTSVSFTTGTTGTDINSSVSNATTTPSITLNIPVASGTSTGKLSSSDWTTFNSKQSAITLTTTGSSGAATFISNTLNIPNYTLSGLGGVPTTRQLTINGTAYDLSADRSWLVGTVTSVQLTAGTGISLAGTNPITTSGTITVTNTAPDQIVTITAGDNISVSGTYPNFTVSAIGETISSFLLMGA